MNPERPITGVVLVVDDDDRNLETASDLIKAMGLKPLTAQNAEQALRIVKNTPPDVILLDVMMPGMNGHQLCTRLKRSPGTREIPIIMLTALNDVEDHVTAIESGADDFMNKPFNPTILRVRIEHLLRNKLLNDRIRDYQNHLEKKVREQTQVIQHVQDAIIHSLASLAEYRDPETNAHLERIRHYSMLMATKLLVRISSPELNGAYINRIFRSSILHDIGKVGIRDNILLKPGRLTPEEFEIMKTHSEIGGRAIDDACQRLHRNHFEEQFLEMARDIAYYHHERYDGTGYPFHLQGDKIPLSARIVSVADVFDALISRRPYKEPMPMDQALEILREGRATQFDPNVLDCFFNNVDSIREIANRFTDEERLMATSAAM